MRRKQYIDRTIHQVTDYQSVNRFLELEDVPAGILSIQDNGVTIDILNHPARSETTIVSFHGALVGDVKLPMLSGLGTTNGIPANRIFISDPSLYLSDRLTLSWYSGSKHQPDLQRDLVAIIAHIAESTGAKNLIFFGISGGGFAALRLSHAFPGSLAVPVNAQVNIDNYLQWATDRYAEHCWDSGMPPDSVCTDLTDLYPETMPNTVAYIQNSRDRFHIDRHLHDFLETVGGNENFLLLMEPWTDGHTPPPKGTLTSILQHAVEYAPAWREAMPAIGFHRRPSARIVRASRVDGPIQLDVGPH